MYFNQWISCINGWISINGWINMNDYEWMNINE